MTHLSLLLLQGAIGNVINTIRKNYIGIDSFTNGITAVKQCIQIKSYMWTTGFYDIQLQSQGTYARQSHTSHKISGINITKGSVQEELNSYIIRCFVCAQCILVCDQVRPHPHYKSYHQIIALSTSTSWHLTAMSPRVRKPKKEVTNILRSDAIT